MSQKKTASFDQHHLEGFERMQADGAAASRSEAIRRAAQVGLDELGYLERTRSPLATAGERVGWVCGMGALVLLGATLAYPVGLRGPAFAALCASVASFGVARLADGAGSDLRRRLARLVGGESA